MKLQLIILLLILNFPGIAQKDNVRERIKSQRIAFITQKLALTPDEAQKFWPVHAQFDAEMKAIHQKEDMPELQREEAVLGVKKKFQDRFTKILGNNRTDNFYRKDIQFRAKLVERLRKMRQQNNINQRPMRRKPGM